MAAADLDSMRRVVSADKAGGGGSWAASQASRRSMQANRPTDTGPEIRLRSALHAAGARFRKNFELRAGDRRVRIDIAFPRAKVAVFVDGCFWHRCPEHGTEPKRNREFWREKFDRNVRRDRAVDRALRQAGWRVVRIWEHEPIDCATAVVLSELGHERDCAIAT